jgi:hypothetical protein
MITREATHHIKFFSKNIISMFSRFTPIINYQINQYFLRFNAIECKAFPVAADYISKLA